MQVLKAGRDLQTIVDAEESPDTTESTTKAKYFDVIGFDPRGVNNTTPGFSCFPDLSSQVTWELQTEADGMLGSSESSFMRHWQRAQALNLGCSLNLATPPAGEDEALGHHVNTAPVARDILEITERHAEWREKQGQIQQALHDNIHGHDPEQHIIARTRWHRNHEKLLYWGRSYGTVLGTTFATMYPDRISRMVLDGVVDVDKYYTGNGPNPVRDADAIFDRFGLYCDAVGPEACPLYTTGGPTSIKEAFLALDEKVHNASIPVMASNTHGPEVITWTDIRTLLRIALYQPIFAFPLFAQYLGQLSNGDGSAMVDFKQGNHRSSCPSNQCQLAGPWSTACRDPGENESYATAAILCSDAEYMGEIDEDGFKVYWDELKRDSKMLGDYWAHIRMSCVGWKAKAKWKISGPFTANTTHPLLFISNTLDPVTPLYSAQKMSQKFPGSVVLRQDSEGHTSGASPSLCIAKGIRQYFQSGELPDVDVVCEADMKPLLGSTMMIKEGMTESEKVLMQAMMNEVQRVRRGPL